MFDGLGVDLFPQTQVMNARHSLEDGGEGEIVGGDTGGRHLDVGANGVEEEAGAGLGAEEFDP